MKVASSLILVVSAHLSVCDGFTISPSGAHWSSLPLAASKQDLTKSVAGAAVAFTIAWGTLASPSQAVAPTATMLGGLESTTVTLSAEYADFSMPSYESALVSPINTNLTGGERDAFGGEMKATTVTSSAPGVVVDEAAAAKKAAQAVEDKKVAAADAKAAQKASRERQKAAADAAMAAAKAAPAIE